MDTMKQMTLNASGVGDLATFHALRAVTAAADDDSTGHDIAVTSGEDGVVYFVDLHTERVLFDAVVCDGTMPALAVVPEQTHLLVVSGDDNELYSYKMPPHFERDALLLRSPIAIRHVACSTSLIAVATEDPEITVLRRAATDEIISVQGHGHGIKSVAFDATGKLLCSASEDGTVRVFAIDEAALSATQLALFKVQFGDIRSEQVLARCAWQPGGDHAELLAVPVNQGIVELFDRSSWTSKGQLLLPMGKSKSSDINVLSFSPNGLYVAGATLQHEVFIWAVATKQCVRSFKVEHHVVAVQWSPTQNVLLAFNDGGKLGVMQDAVPMGLTPPHQLGLGATSTTNTISASASVSTQKRPTVPKKRLNPSQFVDDEAMDDGTAGDDDDDGSEAEFDEGETRVEAIKASFGFGAAAAAMATSGDADLGLTSDRVDDDDDDYTSRLSSYTKSKASSSASSPFQTFQEPFQSGSVEDGAVTLLAWTPLGEIECVRSSSRSEQLVKVEFADKSRRGFKFSDQYLFSMAALDDHGAFFAVPRRAREDWDDDNNTSGIISSFIFYRPFESWASNASWHVDMPEGEDAESIACAREFCAVATSLHCLRVFTTSGIAFAVVRLPGRVVTLTARGSRLAVVYQDSYARLAFKLFEIQITSDADRVRVLAEGVLPLTPPLVDVFASHKENETRRSDVAQYATLKWLGFDERGVLIAIDSIGCVQALASSYGYQWFPVGCVGNALLKKPEDRAVVFTLGVVNNALLYFPLERGQTAPKLRGKHRPVPLKFMLQHAAYPKTLSASSNKKGELQGPIVNDLWQHVRLAAIEGDDDKRVAEQAEMDKSLILMMKAACTNDEPARVLDLAKCLHLEKSHQIAQKLAGHFDFRELQTQLYDLYRDRFERMDRHDQYQVPRRSSSSVVQRVPPSEPMAPASRPQPRLGRQPKPVQPTVREDEEEEVHDEQAGDDTMASAPSSPRAKRELLSASSSSSPPEKENHHTTKPPSVERSVAPVNPFLKKPSASAITEGSTTTKAKASSGGGLERLASFTSPPPAKRSKPWK